MYVASWLIVDIAIFIIIVIQHVIICYNSTNCVVGTAC